MSECYFIHFQFCKLSRFIVLRDIRMVDFLFSEFSAKIQTMDMLVSGDNGIKYYETGGIQTREFPDNSQIVIKIP